MWTGSPSTRSHAAYVLVLLRDPRKGEVPVLCWDAIDLSIAALVVRQQHQRTADNFCTGIPRPTKTEESEIPSFPYHKRGTERDWDRFDSQSQPLGSAALPAPARDHIVDCAASTSGNSYQTGACGCPKRRAQPLT